MVKSKQSTEQVKEALEQGGLPPLKYNSVHALLRRREKHVGDIVRVGADWGLSEWYPNNPTLKKRPKSSTKNQENGFTDAQLKEDESTLAQPAPSDQQERGGGKMVDAAEQILRNIGKPTHINVSVDRLAEYGKSTSAKSLSGSLPQDVKKRFKNLGRNTWALSEWPEDVLSQRQKESQLPL